MDFQPAPALRLTGAERLGDAREGARRCEAAGEPDLTSMVVKTDSREVSDANTTSDQAAERYRCFQFYPARAKDTAQD